MNIIIEHPAWKISYGHFIHEEDSLDLPVRMEWLYENCAWSQAQFSIASKHPLGCYVLRYSQDGLEMGWRDPDSSEVWYYSSSAEASCSPWSYVISSAGLALTEWRSTQHGIVVAVHLENIRRLCMAGDSDEQDQDRDTVTIAATS